MSNASLATSVTLTNEPTITPEFDDAFELLENTQDNVFITGRAGTGKSTFLQYFRKNTSKNVVVVAPTGIAALNVEGQTIHSLFRLKPQFINVAELKPNRSKVIKELEMLIIDEISMVRADVFDGINQVLKISRKNNKPFGGVQICVIGDLFQLPPVVGANEQEFFAQHYESPFFFSAKSFSDASFKTIQFDTIHRQSDQSFIQVLNAIRDGNCGKADLEHINSRVSPRATPAPGTLVLTTTNALADQINNTRLAKLPINKKIYEGEFSGDFNLSGTRLPSPEQLELKVGAQVMFVKNDSSMRWVNGTVGIIESLGSEVIEVRVGSEIHEVTQVKWKTVGYEFDEEEEKIVEKSLGSYTQFPLILAWAITIHKSQGKTLERVIIDIGTGAFVAGQLYVALSRCKTLAGIALKQPITLRDIMCDETVQEFGRSVR